VCRGATTKREFIAFWLTGRRVLEYTSTSGTSHSYVEQLINDLGGRAIAWLNAAATVDADARHVLRGIAAALTDTAGVAVGPGPRSTAAR